MTKILHETEELTFEETKKQILDEINAREYNVPYWFILSFIENMCKNDKWSHLSSSKAISITSYGLKHQIEQSYCNPDKVTIGFQYGYCGNNWVKLALYELGFNILKTDYIDYETGKLIEKDCYLTYKDSDIIFNDILNNGINFVFKRERPYYRDMQSVYSCINYKIMQ